MLLFIDEVGLTYQHVEPLSDNEMKLLSSGLLRVFQFDRLNLTYLEGHTEMAIQQGHEEGGNAPDIFEGFRVTFLSVPK